MKSKSILLLIILFFFFHTNSFCQIKEVGVGIYGGAGNISGNLPSQTCFTVGATLDFLPSFTGGLPLRLGVIYARKIEVILPTGLQGRYYPFVKGIFLKGILQQPLGKIGYLEETIGPLLLNDRTFNDVDAYDIGAVFSLLVGLDFRDLANKGFKSGFGVEYGSTFTGTTAQYTSIHLLGQFYF
ncbi:MAG: hypothetical protein NTX22_16365 [Ignavibacteriales bacterium]|nr:hypothetical protein [Ignavibacteriales bacterium]